MALFMAGLIAPLAATIAAVQLGAPSAVRFADGAIVLVVCDAPIVRAGSSGRGSSGVVQPWRWSAYLGWAAARIALLVLAAYLS